MIEAKGKEQNRRRNPKNEGKELSGNGGVFSGMSLQDVFSDSAGNPGLMLKTPCPSADEAGRPEMDGGNASQLGVPGTKRKRRVGRKELTVEQKRTRKLQLHLTENEYLELWQRQIALGKKSMAEYLRDLVINEKTTNMAINSVALISQMDKIGQEIAKSSTNIRAIANAMENQTDKTIEPQILHRFNPPGGRGNYPFSASQTFLKCPNIKKSIHQLHFSTNLSTTTWAIGTRVAHVYLQKPLILVFLKGSQSTGKS